MVTPESFLPVAEFATEHQIPFGGAYFTVDTYSSIFGANVDFFETGKLTAPLVNKVLNGTPAGTVPVATPDYFIQINYTVAQQFGITVPETLLKQANEVIR
jgi:putative ABC transport system substrate-binding protein